MATKKPNIEEKSVLKKRGGARPGTGGAREGAGRPAFEPTDAERKQVEALTRIHLKRWQDFTGKTSPANTGKTSPANTGKTSPANTGKTFDEVDNGK